jgi:hypothetical protein
MSTVRVPIPTGIEFYLMLLKKASVIPSKGYGYEVTIQKTA